MPSYRGQVLLKNGRLQIWGNNGRGNFRPIVIDRGKDSHLGARIFDIDGDSDFDIVSIAWRDFQLLHLWRNDAINNSEH